MKRILLALLAGVSLMGAMKPNENLLLNGDFEELQLGFPPYWERTDFQDMIFLWTEGPEASGVLRFQSSGISKTRPVVMQKGTRLVPGERYSLSILVRAKDFRASKVCFGLRPSSDENASWTGISEFPENCDEWTELHFELTAPPSPNGKYDVAIFLERFSGRLDVAQARLHALSDKALAYSLPTEGVSFETTPRIFPYSPLLQEIPAEKPVLFFRRGGFFRDIADAPARELEAVFAVDGAEIARMAATEEIPCPLAGIPQGTHLLQVELRRKDNGETIFRRDHEIRIVSAPSWTPTPGRRLNNFVVELLNREFKAEEQEEIVLAQEKWLFVQAEKGLLLDGETLNGENFRLLAAGPHVLKALTDGHVVVRAVSEIFHSAVCESNHVRQNSRYDWEFSRKYVFPALTTANRFACPEEHLEEWKAGKLRWLGNIVTVDAKDAADFRKRLDDSEELHDALHNGVTLDEHYYSQDVMPAVADVLWSYPVPAGKLLYTWTTGLPDIHNAIALEHISAVFNAAKGKSLLLVESYCASQETQKLMSEYLHRRLNQCYNAYKAANPAAPRKVALILGNFSQPPLYSLDALPEVDFKYALDMQLHHLATDPDFVDMPAIGYWGNHYTTEEMYRWSAKLLRHYCVEGKTTLLSEEFGFQYLPGHLHNGDFREHFEKWEVRTGKGGQARWDVVSALYGRLRWGSQVQNGTTCCVFVRGETASQVSQRITGLTPGRPYVLQFVTGDYDSLLKGQYVNRTHHVDATLSEEVDTLSRFLIDGSLALSDWDRHSVKIHYWRFIPKTDSMTVTFSDETAEPGDSFTLNYISVKPYFAEE